MNIKTRTALVLFLAAVSSGCANDLSPEGRAVLINHLQGQMQMGLQQIRHPNRLPVSCFPVGRGMTCY